MIIPLFHVSLCVYLPLYYLHLCHSFSFRKTGYGMVLYFSWLIYMSVRIVVLVISLLV